MEPQGGHFSWELLGGPPDFSSTFSISPKRGGLTPKLFQKNTLHSASLLYRSRHEAQSLSHSLQSKKEDEKRYQGKRSTMHRSPHSTRDEPTYSSRGSFYEDSPSWHPMMSRSTASGSQLLSSPRYLSENETSHESLNPELCKDSSDLYSFSSNLKHDHSNFSTNHTLHRNSKSKQKNIYTKQQQQQQQEDDLEDDLEDDVEEDLEEDLEEDTEEEEEEDEEEPDLEDDLEEEEEEEEEQQQQDGNLEEEEEEDEDDLQDDEDLEEIGRNDKTSKKFREKKIEKHFWKDRMMYEEDKLRWSRAMERENPGVPISAYHVSEESEEEDSRETPLCRSPRTDESEDEQEWRGMGFSKKKKTIQLRGTPFHAVEASDYPDFPTTFQSENPTRRPSSTGLHLNSFDESLGLYTRDIQSTCDASQYQPQDSCYSARHDSRSQEAMDSLPNEDQQESLASPPLSDDGDDSESYAVHDRSFEPYSLSEIDQVVDIVYDPMKGRCVVAKKVFQPGEIIFIEVPTLVAIPSIAPDLWEKLEQLNQEKPFELPPIWHLASLYALTRLSTKKKNIILDKWVPDPHKAPGHDVKRVLSHFRLAVDAYRYERFLQAWRYNSFGHHTENDGLVLYNRISMISHNCSATATWHYGENDAFILRARQFIPQGSEISISYIGDDDLYKPTHTRQEKLSGWLFTCQCVRCMDPCDSTRGFRCPCCGTGITFFRTEKYFTDPPHEEFTIATPCTLCQRVPSSKTIKKYLLFENAYIARLDEMDKSNLSDVELVYSEAQRVFNQHWVLYALDSLLFSAYRDHSHWEEACCHQHNRIQYITQVIPKASYTLAWLYEELGDVFANSISENFHADPPPMTGFQRNFLAKMYETAMNMLFILCGSQHNYTLAAHKKLSQVFGSLGEENS